MKTTKILYWTTTVLAALLFLMSGIMELTHAPAAMAGTQKLGYPEYLADILGVAKVLGSLALLVPKFPLLKEWAYAGFVFDMIGAAWSLNAAGDHSGSLAVVVPMIIVLASYILYRKLQSAPETKIA